MVFSTRTRTPICSSGTTRPPMFVPKPDLTALEQVLRRLERGRAAPRGRRRTSVAAHDPRSPRRVRRRQASATRRPFFEADQRAPSPATGWSSARGRPAGAETVAHDADPPPPRQGTGCCCSRRRSGSSCPAAGSRASSRCSAARRRRGPAGSRSRRPRWPTAIATSPLDAGRRRSTAERYGRARRRRRGPATASDPAASAEGSRILGPIRAWQRAARRRDRAAARGRCCAWRAPSAEPGAAQARDLRWRRPESRSRGSARGVTGTAPARWRASR